MDAFQQLLSGEISKFDVNTNNDKIIAVKTEPHRNKSNKKKGGSGQAKTNNRNHKRRKLEWGISFSA
jgi:hypothetical protein